MTIQKATLTASILSIILSGCGSSREPVDVNKTNNTQVPANKFDLSHWYLTVPMDDDNDKVSDIYDVAKLKTYQHPDFFYLDDNQHMVFASPNKA
ncbi:polysaccharide lyase family 7 protein, partial [Paraglaciecola sp.]